MKLSRRLLPLYIGIFLQGMVFWYAIEKLFMTDIGFDANMVAISVATYSAVALLTEIPSGILADRWSRKGVLILSSLAIGASSFFGSISYGIPVYLISSAMWGLYISMGSGTVESIIYDLLLEKDGDGKKYKKYMAKIGIINSAGLIISAFSGGLIANFAGLRETYLLSVPIAILSVIFLLLFKEPKLHLENQDKSLIKHTKATFKVLLSNSNLLWLVISMVGSGMVWSLIMEMNQMWLIALLMPIILYGPTQALTYSVFGLGGILSNFIKSKARVIFSMFISLICIIGLIYSRNLWATFTAIFLIMLTNCSIGVVMSHNLNDGLPSKTRAGSMSAISALKRLLIIPSSIIFGIIAANFGIFQAGWFAAALFIIAIFAQFLVRYEVKEINS